MTVKDLIRGAYSSSDVIIQRYLDGLSKSDLMIRAVPGMNHIAWQLGHLIAGERMMVELVKPGSSPPLPEGFEAIYETSKTSNDDASQFLGPDEYLALWKRQREATLAVLDGLSDVDFDRTEPGKFPPFAPTVGALIHLAGTHPILHSGQFVAVRRLLGLPIAF